MELEQRDAGKVMQRQLMGSYYRDLEQGEGPVAYLFVPGNVVELLRPFGFRAVYPEINALQCGVKKVAGENILKAEDIGYSSDVCGYVKNDIGICLGGGQTPLGRIPKPDLLVCNFSGCNTFIKWFEALADFYEAPMFLLDIPYVRDRESYEQDVEYVTQQLWDLVAYCEELSGVTFNESSLREALEYSRQAEDLWAELLNMPRRRPSPFDAYFEAVFFMAPINVLRGTKECVEYYRVVIDEMEERSQAGVGPVPEEKFRVVYEGPPCWPHFRSFWELFKAWGVVGVASTYSKVGGLFETGVRHDPSRPMESIAEYVINCYTNWNLEKRAGLLHHYIEDFEADALVIHSVKSCRSFSVGQADFREVFSHDLGIPTLMIESDLADPRYFSQAQLKNRVDAFFESLEHQRIMRGS
jgi:benzoyl-CoA reductase subunit B